MTICNAFDTLLQLVGLPNWIQYIYIKKSVQNMSVIDLSFLAKNPCQQNSIGCDDICLLSDGKEKCACRNGYALQQDGKTCKGS